MELIKASLDRFEGDSAIIYSDIDDRKFDVPRTMVNAKAGTRLLIYLDQGCVIKVETDEKSTAEAKERIVSKYHKLLKSKHLNDKSNC